MTVEMVEKRKGSEKRVLVFVLDMLVAAALVAGGERERERGRYERLSVVTM